MTAWAARSSEERALLNPAFCAALLWHAARGHETTSGAAGMPFETSFLVLPIVLHAGTRGDLPKTLSTSLPVWLESYPLSRSRIADRARLLVPFTKEAMNFGGLHGLLRFAAGSLVANVDWKKLIQTNIKGATDEVRACMKRSEFIGRWFAATGNAATVMALLGVRP